MCVREPSCVNECVVSRRLRHLRPVSALFFRLLFVCITPSYFMLCWCRLVSFFCLFCCVNFFSFLFFSHPPKSLAVLHEASQWIQTLKLWRFTIKILIIQSWMFQTRFLTTQTNKQTKKATYLYISIQQCHVKPSIRLSVYFVAPLSQLCLWSGSDVSPPALPNSFVLSLLAV